MSDMFEVDREIKNTYLKMSIGKILVRNVIAFLKFQFLMMIFRIERMN